MKKIAISVLLSLLFVYCFSQMPQTPGAAPRSNSTVIPEDYNLSVRSTFLLPRFSDTTQANANTKLDTCGRIIYTYSDNKILLRACSPKRWVIAGGTIGTVANGITLAGDTAILGDSLNRFTYTQVLYHMTNGTRLNQLRYGNVPFAQSVGSGTPLYPYVATYNAATLAIDRLFSEANHDTAFLQYGGGFSGVTRMNYDSFPSIYGATISRPKDITLASQGVEYLYQVNFPRDTARVVIGRDGFQGSVMVGQTDYGQTWGYNINVYSQNGLPDMPLSTYKANLDFQRNIDNTRRYKMTGNGVAQYLSAYKTYQTAINSSTYEVGDYISKVMGFHAYGSMYPLLSVATKAKTLLVSKVDSSFGFVAEPQYRYTNDINNGYGFWMKGDSDYNHLNGWLTIGPTLPTRENGGQLFRYKLNVTGKGHFTDSLISDGNISGFVVKGQGMIVSINTGIGNEAGINYLQTDSAITASTLAYVTASRDLRGFAIRSEGYSAANYPNDGTGMFVQIETGANHAFLTRWHRNGNMAVGYVNGVTTPYRLYKKLTVNGASAFLDTVTIKNIPIAPAGDTTNYFNLGINSNGDVFRVSYGSGGGSSTWNAITSPTGTQTLTFDDGELNDWTISSNTETFHTYTANSLTSGTGMLWTLNGLTSGNGISITTNSTAKAAGNALYNGTSSGANGTSSITNIIYNASNTNTGTTSTNVGFNSNVSGASTNWAFKADAGNYRSTGAAGYYALNSAGTAGISMAYDNGTIGTITTTGGVRLDLDAASSTILARRSFVVGIGIDFGNAVSLDVYKSASGTSNIQNWRSSGGTVLANVNQSGSFFIGGSTSATALLHLAAGTATASTAPLKLTTGTVNTTAEAGAFEYTTPQLFFTNGAAVRQELFQGQQSRVSTQFDKTDVTLANVTGLTANVAAGKTYRFEAILYTTSDVAGGVKAAISGTATATNIVYEGFTINAGTVTQTRGTALATAVGAITAVTAAYIHITGTITVNAAGTLTVQFAENAAVNTSSVLVGSTFYVIEML